MSAAVAVTAEVALSATAGRKKRLIMIGAAVLLVLVIVAVAAVFWLRSRAAHAAELAESGEDGAPTQAVAKAGEGRPPTFLPLEPFVVNLADKEADRYAQIGITLELESGAFADQMKAYMPAVRNAILLIIAHKNSRQLLDRSGKEELAEEIMRDAVRPMGIEIAAPLPVTVALATAGEATSTAASRTASGATSVVAPASASSPSTDKPRRRAETQKNPILHVHFSSFIVQ